jgi:hypothetical protein
VLEEKWVSLKVVNLEPSCYSADLYVTVRGKGCILVYQAIVAN